MATQNFPEVPQPPGQSYIFRRPKSLILQRTDELSIQNPNKNAVPESSPSNVDTKIGQVEEVKVSASVVEDGDGETQGGVIEHTESVQKLKDRLNGLEQRLRQAGLLEKPGVQTDSKVNPEETDKSKGSKSKDESKPLDLKDGTDLPSSRDEMGDKRKPGQIKKSLKDTEGRDSSVQVLVHRIDSLQRRLEEAGHLKDKPASDKPRLPAIPQLLYVEWSDFKNKLAGEQPIHAIEVLTGGAKYYHQRPEEERKNKQRLKDHSNDRDQPVNENWKSKTLPERIRINSKPVVLIMNEIDPTDRSEEPIVMLRPFKPLIYHEGRIREVFQKLKAKWGNTDVEAPTNQPNESTITEDPGNSETPAVSDGAIGSISAESNVPSKVETALDHIFDIDKVTITASDETVTRRDRISPPPSAKIPPLSFLSANESLQKSSTIEDENPSSKAMPDIGPKSTGNEETEDLTDSVEALQDLRCLIEFIDSELRPVADSYRGTTRQKILFSDMWHLFKPGDLLYIPLGNKQASDNLYSDGKAYPQKPNDRFQEVMRIGSTAGGRPHLEPSPGNYTGTGHKSKINAFLISAYWVDFNGTRFASRAFVFYIIPFLGERDITSLQCYPLSYSPKGDELKSKLKARGEAFREYTTFKTRYYTGKSLTCSPDGYHSPEGHPKHAENIDSQVVVDFSEALAAYPGWRSVGSNLALADEDAPGEVAEEYPTSFWKDSYRKVLDEARDDEIYDDEHIDDKLLEEYIERDALLRDHPQTSRAGHGEFDEDHLVLLPNRVFGFVMKNRKWAMLTVDGLRPIKRYVGGFKDLQLPIGHKRTISSLVNNHFINKNPDLDALEASYDADLVRGKGKGLIILLHGAPGVGKTSTAETVADAFGKLLFPITCGDLGLTAVDVERELSEKFNMAELWDCVLLLDEADVFLARRMNTDIKRNSLVSVFLRVLEHFTGVLFLTTNRVGAFDEAFKSRIHISLYYPPLDAEKTRDIWKMNLERLSNKKQRRNESMEFNENEIFAYAQHHYNATSPHAANCNGRQIRNAFQTASALAEFEAYELNRKRKARCAETGKVFVPTDPQLKVSHFREIASASYEFDKYISETKGFTDAEIAYQEGQRMDGYRGKRGLVRDRDQQPIQTREAPTLLSVPIREPGHKMQGKAAPAGLTSASGNRQTFSRTPAAFTHDAPESQDLEYDQPPARRETKSINTYGARTTTTIPRGERPSATRSRPNSVKQPISLAIQDKDRQRHEVFDQHEPQYEGEEDQVEYEPPYEGSFTQPTSTYVPYEDTTQHEISPRRLQVRDRPAMSRKPAVFDHGGDLEDDEDFFDI